MYLATIRTNGQPVFELRCSIPTTDNLYRPQLVFHLGPDPTEHFEVVEEHIVLFSPPLLQAVESHSAKAELILEKLLWPFLPPETRRRNRHFTTRQNLRVGPLSAEEQDRISREIHLFDRRRLYYLRYGAVDQSRLRKMHEKCCRPLLGQSRDEREFYFQAEEQVLDPGKYLQYVYAIFNLQEYFPESFASWFPEALARDRMADHLIEELCRLNRSERFWQRGPHQSSLHPHLVRYLIMFFDYSPQPRSFARDFGRRFMADHRRFRWPDLQPTQSPERVQKLFGANYETLRKMTKNEFTRLYRQKAMRLHPDQGGDHQLFIDLTEIYKRLIIGKK